MATPASSKKQIIESIKDKKNILVTVSNNPSVDELAAALGLTIFLNKLDKHATAIASGNIPSALDFLDPGKTFEATADSLRDFIIALDKEKADHLRYKLEGDVVKIFITPYRNTITQNDLEFSQGDYNVEMVIALNVASRDELDKALSAHGKILHDAVVATITTGDVKSSLGTLDWHEDAATGVSEMATEVAQELKTAKADIDEQIATAFLTGIVASTDRFSNDLTSSKVMTMSAELMASGANQQLIAAQLESSTESVAPVNSPVDTPPNEQVSVASEESSPVDDDPTRLTIDRSAEPVVAATPDVPSEPVEATGTMSINHELVGSLDQVASQVRQESQEDAARAAEEQLSEIAESAAAAQPAHSELEAVVAPVAEAAPASITAELEQATAALQSAPEPIISQVVAANEMGTPMVGGTLNATTAAAAEQKREDLRNDQNRTILTHGGGRLGDQPALGSDAPLNAAMAAQQDEMPSVDIFAAPITPPTIEPLGMVETPDISPLMPQAEAAVSPFEPAPQPAPVFGSETQDALAAVNAVLESAPEPQIQPEPMTAMPAAPMDSTMGIPTLADIESSSVTGLPPMPDFSSLPPLPSAPIGIDPSGLPTAPMDPVATPQEFNPAQFQIPPQT